MFSCCRITHEEPILIVTKMATPSSASSSSGAAKRVILGEDDIPDEQELCNKARVGLSWFVGGMPYIPSNTDFVSSMPKIASVFQGEFFWATCYRPEFVAELMYRGFLPMAFAEGKVEVITPKLHVMRSLVMFGDVPKPHGSSMKKAKKFEFTADTAFAEVAAGIVKIHDHSWFYPNLVKTFTRMNQAGENGWFNGRVRVHSFEVWQDNKLVAGECGYSCGKVYTSLSGFTFVDGAGTVQMYAMANHLKSLGFVVWDLGMQMEYKEHEFGAKQYPRLEFLKILSNYRDEVITTSVKIDVRTNARMLLQLGQPPRGDIPAKNKKKNDGGHNDKLEEAHETNKVVVE
jgi:Leu/Phe-tRNA-protein transferase